MKLNIANIDIRQDAHGRFNLADVHKSAGGANRHLPFRWLRQKRTQDLVKALELEHQLWCSKLKEEAENKARIRALSEPENKALFRALSTTQKTLKDHHDK